MLRSRCFLTNLISVAWSAPAALQWSVCRPSIWTNVDLKATPARAFQTVSRSTRDASSVPWDTPNHIPPLPTSIPRHLPLFGALSPSVREVSRYSLIIKNQSVENVKRRAVGIKPVQIMRSHEIPSPLFLRYSNTVIRVGPEQQRM